VPSSGSSRERRPADDRRGVELTLKHRVIEKSTDTGLIPSRMPDKLPVSPALGKLCR
jgi:hypothetical protein